MRKFIQLKVSIRESNVAFETIFENHVFLISTIVKFEVFSWFLKKPTLSQISKEKDGSCVIMINYRKERNLLLSLFWTPASPIKDRQNYFCLKNLLKLITKLPSKSTIKQTLTISKYLILSNCLQNIRAMMVSMTIGIERYCNDSIVFFFIVRSLRIHQFRPANSLHTSI
jgi:hypothetical protein